ncbi:hypothetical protein D0Z07_6367 [Hyphodiscus hymeniophilus]|uniref:Ribosome biogenesis protein ALB1 n=1 Tax=Hyphodiscus hymeniophilus TaxID=353542 RepID=A0A9P7AUP6_9HELO|nr:hypothetical protein D0Z07_6367 [Hyphodiscus hymeniophilus]
MPSRGNPNVPNKQRRIANRTKVQKRNAQKGVTKNARGTRTSSVLHPTSGPLAPISGKKARKLEKAANHARQRAIEKGLEAEGEVEMTAPKTTAKKTENVHGEKMEIDDIA